MNTDVIDKRNGEGNPERKTDIVKDSTTNIISEVLSESVQVFLDTKTWLIWEFNRLVDWPWENVYRISQIMKKFLALKDNYKKQVIAKLWKHKNSANEYEVNKALIEADIQETYDSFSEETKNYCDQLVESGKALSREWAVLQILLWKYFKSNNWEEETFIKFSNMIKKIT